MKHTRPGSPNKKRYHATERDKWCVSRPLFSFFFAKVVSVRCVFLCYSMWRRCFKRAYRQFCRYLFCQFPKKNSKKKSENISIKGKPFEIFIIFVCHFILALVNAELSGELGRGYAGPNCSSSSSSFPLFSAPLAVRECVCTQTAHACNSNSGN